jgi:uncharacterized protein
VSRLGSHASLRHHNSFFATVLARADIISATLPGMLHVAVGLMAFCHAVASLTQAFAGRQLAPLSLAILQPT